MQTNISIGGEPNRNLRWSSLQGISPQLIILRVAMGNIWTKNNVSSGGIQSTAMQFQNNHGSTTRISQGSGTDVIITKEHIKDEVASENRNVGDIFFVASAV